MDEYSGGKICIKIPAPGWRNVHLWGEYHFALGIKKEFERKNWKVLIQPLSEWYSQEDKDYDVVIVLRGNSKYIPRKYHFNIMWNICHPNMISVSEYNMYDHVFVASNIWAKHLYNLCDVEVEPLLQCTDPELFYPIDISKYINDLLFVGNSRGVFRRIIKDVLPTDKDLAVYGYNWDRCISRKYIKATHIPNKKLSGLYSSCKILLNDHWDDMREKGFLSNRLFDGFASGAFIISDNIEGSKEVFGNALVTYNSREELKSLIEEYLNDENLRKEKAKRGYEIVINNHTFEKRIDRIIRVIQEKNK